MRGLQERGSVPPVAARRLALAGTVALVVVTGDQLTKSWALRALDEGPVHLFWTLRLNLSFNTGAAFGVAPGMGPLLVVVAIVVLIALVGLGRRAIVTRGGAVFLGLVLGGALGNLADRVLRDHGGAVIDFIDLQWWPVFNLADAAISCGVVLLVVSSWQRPRG